MARWVFQRVLAVSLRELTWNAVYLEDSANVWESLLSASIYKQVQKRIDEILFQACKVCARNFRALGGKHQGNVYETGSWRTLGEYFCFPLNFFLDIWCSFLKSVIASNVLWQTANIIVEKMWCSARTAWSDCVMDSAPGLYRTDQLAS